MKCTETRQPKGIFRLKVFKADKLVEEYEDKNLIVDQGLNHIRDLVSGASPDPIDTIGFGEGTSSPAAGDTTLTNSYEKAIASVTTPGTGDVTFEWTLETTEGNGMAITEFGLLYGSSLLFSRKTRAAINKDSDIRLEGTWTIQF